MALPVVSLLMQENEWIRSQNSAPLWKFISFLTNPNIATRPSGLLLLIRVNVYLVSAFNPSGDLRVTLLATNFIVTTLLLYIATLNDLVLEYTKTTALIQWKCSHTLRLRVTVCIWKFLRVTSYLYLHKGSSYEAEIMKL